MRFPPIVSVLTTVYNREPYIAACIESVLAQTLDDFELIIVDDCSTDNSHVVAERYRTDPRVHLYRNETNLGDYPNRNQAASLAMGKYLKYVDADDLIYPHCLELMVEGMETYPEAGYGISRELPSVMAPALLSPRDAYRSHFFLTGLFSVGPLDAILRRDVFESIGGFSPARYTSDTEFFLRIGAGWPGVILAPCLVWWRHHAGQESVEEGLSCERILDVTLRRHRNVRAAIDSESCPLSEREARIIRWQTKAHLFKFALGQVQRGNLQYARRILREAFFAGRTGEDASASPVTKTSNSMVSELLPGDRPPPTGKSFVSRCVPTLPPINDTPCVSVLIPAHNAGATLDRALRSLFAQRFSDWELVLVDDASQDETAAVAARYLDDPRVRYERNPRRLGKWPNHHKAATLARGHYIKFLHADDQLYPDALRLMCNELDAAVGDRVVMPSNAAPPGRWHLGPEDAVRYHYFVQPIFGSLIADGLISRRLFLAEAHRRLESFAWDVAMGVRCVAAAGVTLCPPGIVNHARNHPLGIGLPEKYPMGLAEAFATQHEMLLDTALELSLEERGIMERHLRYGFARRLQRLFLSGRWAEARDALRRNDLGLAIVGATRCGPHPRRHQIRADLLARLFH